MLVEGPRYDIVFGRFFDGEPDQVRGLVAYGLYKIAKCEWIGEVTERTEVAPDRSAIDNYTLSWTKSMISGKQAEADAILRDYGSSVVAAERSVIVEAALRGSTSRSVAIKIGSAFLYTLLLVGIVVVLRFAGVDIVSLASSAAG